MRMGEATGDALSNAEVELAALDERGHFPQACPDEFYPRVGSFLELTSQP
jgi:hypothetical protein